MIPSRGGAPGRLNHRSSPLPAGGPGSQLPSKSAAAGLELSLIPAGRGVVQALADGYRPAMMVMGGLCAAAVIVIGLFVLDGGTAASRPAPRPRRHGRGLPVLHPRATT